MKIRQGKRADISSLLWRQTDADRHSQNTTYHNREGGSRHKIFFGVRQINSIRRAHKLHTAEFLFPHLTTCKYQTVCVAVGALTVDLHTLDI